MAPPPRDPHIAQEVLCFKERWIQTCTEVCTLSDDVMAGKLSSAEGWTGIVVCCTSTEIFVPLVRPDRHQQHDRSAASTPQHTQKNTNLSVTLSCIPFPGAEPHRRDQTTRSALVRVWFNVHHLYWTNPSLQPSSGLLTEHQQPPAHKHTRYFSSRLVLLPLNLFLFRLLHQSLAVQFTRQVTLGADLTDAINMEKVLTVSKRWATWDSNQWGVITNLGCDQESSETRTWVNSRCDASWNNEVVLVQETEDEKSGKRHVTL